MRLYKSVKLRLSGELYRKHLLPYWRFYAAFLHSEKSGTSKEYLKNFMFIQFMSELSIFLVGGSLSIPFIYFCWEKLLSKSRGDDYPGILIFEGIAVVKPDAADFHMLRYEMNDILMDAFLDGIVRERDNYGEGPYELGEHVRLKSGDIVIDCGANMGVFSSLAAHKGCKVYAFEPSGAVVDRYLRHVAHYMPGITICPYALGDRKGELLLYVHRTNIGGTKTAETNINDGMEGFHHPVTVPVTTIDDYVFANGIPRVDFIKADIEGAERNMLRGATRVLREFAPKLAICTYHLPDDPKVLREIILSANPEYKIVERYKKMYAYVP